MLGDAQIGRKPLQRTRGSMASPVKVARAADLSAALHRRQSAAKSRPAAANPAWRYGGRRLSMVRTVANKRVGVYEPTLPLRAVQRKCRSPIISIARSHR